jgi:gliding motility-associated lipoprotein GldH
MISQFLKHINNSVQKVSLFKSCLILLLFVFLGSCDKKTVYQEKQEIETGQWEIGEVKRFQIKIKETNLNYNIYTLIDITEDFPTENLHLRVKSTSPSGNNRVDTVHYYVCDKTGKWYGKKSGSIIRNKFVYKTNVKFVEAGEYHFEYEHLMREHQLPRLRSIGLSIEKVLLAD